MSKKVGSDGQIRKTTAEWTADTNTYPEGMRLMDTDTGTVRTSSGGTYAQAWTPGGGGGETPVGLGYVFDDTASAAGISNGQIRLLPDVIVSGAGTAAANGTYRYAGEYNGRPWFAKIGGVNSGDALTGDSVCWNGAWVIYSFFDPDWLDAYPGDASDTPWDVVSWGVGKGSNPAPTVTASTASWGAIYVAETDANGNGMSEVLATFSAGGLLYVNVTSDDTAYAVFKVTAAVKNDGYYTLTGTYLSGVLPNDGGAVRLTIAPVEVTGVKRACFRITQSGTDAPVIAETFYNSLGEVPSFGYVDIGTYSVTWPVSGSVNSKRIARGSGYTGAYGAQGLWTEGYGDTIFGLVDGNLSNGAYGDNVYLFVELLP